MESRSVCRSVLVSFVFRMVLRYFLGSARVPGNLSRCARVSAAYCKRSFFSDEAVLRGGIVGEFLFYGVLGNYFGVQLCFGLTASYLLFRVYGGFLLIAVYSFVLVASGGRVAVALLRGVIRGTRGFFRECFAALGVVGSWGFTFLCAVVV